MTTEEKLHHFNSIILESTEAECNEAFEEYKQSMDKYFEAHKKERAEKHKLEEKVEADNIKRTASKEYTTEQLHIRRKINHKQEELKNKLLAEVETLMESYFTTEDYKKLLIKQINEAVTVARGEEIHIFLDAKDERLKEELEAACNVQLIADGRTFYGGIRAEIPKKNILIDNSFESKLDNWKETYLIEPGM
ncbi:MAG: hypothetical protein K1W00_00560 [Lachnospiraceae bacterium]